VKRPAVKSKQPAATPAVATRTLPVRRWVSIGVVVCAVLGAAGAVGSVVRANNEKAFAAPTDAAGPGSFGVPVKGSPAVTLTVFEDMRDPASATFDTTYGPALAGLNASGTVTLVYRETAGVDAAQGGTGSLQAGNALGCAQDAGHFAKYRAVLLANQPSSESDDAFGSQSELVTLAKQVKGLNTDVFRACLDNGAHKVWVKDSTADFTAANLGPVPVLQMTVRGRDGTTTLVGNGQQTTPDKLVSTVLAAAMQPATATPSPSSS
jgi:hypothetical protein